MTQELILNEQVTPKSITPAQQSAWLGMAQAKNDLTAQLTNLELQAQAILLKVKESEDYTAIDTALADYRKQHASIVDLRKAFTNKIDAGIIQPLMAIEKRVDSKTNTEYLTQAAKSLQLRKIEAEKVVSANQKNNEKAQFIAHLQNEYMRIAMEYRQDLWREFSDYYKTCLNEKVATPDLTSLKEALKELPFHPIKKFESKYHSKDELLDIYISVRSPDTGSIYADEIPKLETMFSNYESDLANAEEAIKWREQQAALAKMEADKKLAEEQSINTLITTAETVIEAEPVIKKAVKIVIVESEVWAKSVIAAFITNLPKLTKYIRVKSWSKLSIGQMAEYLGKLATDEGVKFNNLTFDEIEK